MARWTKARILEHSQRIPELRADPAGPYAHHSAKLRAAHASGKHPGFGQRTRMSEEERREHARLVTMRYRARKAGNPIARDMLPAKQSDTSAWSVAEAWRPLDALLATRVG